MYLCYYLQINYYICKQISKRIEFFYLKVNNDDTGH